MNNFLFKERSGSDSVAQYANSFRVYSGDGETVLELGQVDLAHSIKESSDKQRTAVVDIKGRYVFRSGQVSQLVNALVASIEKGGDA